MISSRKKSSAKLFSLVFSLFLIGMTLTPTPPSALALTNSPAMIKDINPTGGSNITSGFVIFKGIAYFGADDGSHGKELWRSDGTPGGTFMVKNINPGSADSDPKDFMVIGKTLYFAATNALTGRELWKTKGTKLSTKMVKDIRSGVDGSTPGDLANVGGTLFFSAYSLPSDKMLWKSDGTAAGTKLVKNIGSGNDLVTDIVNYNGKAFFRADDGINGSELWKSNGFAAGTKMVSNINIQPDISASSTPQNLIVYNGKLYFTAQDFDNGFELFVSDGTEGGTTLFKSFYPGTTSSSPSGFTIFNNELFMSAKSGNGREIWKTNGDPDVAYTHEVININPLSADSNPTFFTPVEGNLFFRANDGTNGIELWKTDGTTFNGTMVKNLNPSGDSSPTELTTLNGILYFKATHSGSDFELWQSNGTDLGTTRVMDINPGAGSSSLDGMTAFKNGLLFAANDGTHGLELWYYKPTRIFADGFESGNTNAWSGVVGAGFEDLAVCKLCVVQTGAIHGAKSLKVRIPNKMPHFLSDTNPNSETKYHASFKIKLGNTLVMDNLNKFTVFKGKSGSQTAFSLEIRRKDTIYQIRAVIRNNLGNNLATQWTPLPVKPTNIEIEWEALPDFGFINLYINGNLKRTKGGISNDSFTIDTVHLGITQKIKAIFNISGSFILDNFDSDNYIVYN